MSSIDRTLHVGAPNIGDRESFHHYVDEIFDRRWLTNRGELVQEFEQKLADYLGVKHCITMCNGTVALEIAIRALDLKGEVIIPSLTFIATAHALQWQEITPVFCDIDRETYCMDPAEVEKHITPKTTAIMGVHLYSRPCDVEALQAVADKHGLKLLFDAAHAFGCSHKGTMIGNFGECEVFSFHATKFFNTFEGGAITTNNDALADKIRLMQNFGFERMDKVVYIGTNGKMNEICAAMGLTNLKDLCEFLQINKRNYEAYKEGFQNISGLKLIEFDESEHCNRQYIVVEVLDEYPLSRDKLMEKLHAQNIRVRRYFWPGCHRMEPYKSLQPNAGMMLPVTETIADRILVFPTGTAIDTNMVSKIMAECK
ncbi:MAG: aminotransferase class I/II-fold pyridoxal phosphate-dependent enzyme [Kiritimatiellales bacterium]|nr:aminotransferase class I/II-fold pyridoxal phosphate-dependent enzyme [Pontiella sp.]NNJ71119.1 aminotransferase class I/II-fold pyridoxal phosphate-dependent enzyme [Kiritimatiellales bacterium]